MLYKNQTASLEQLLKRPEVFISDIQDPFIEKIISEYAADTIFAVETSIKYAGYEKRELKRIEKIKKMDNVKFPKRLNYDKIKNLSIESKEKLTAVQPETLGQASRISGVRSSDVAVLSLMLLSKKNVSRETT